MSRGWKPFAYASATVAALTGLYLVEGLEPAVGPFLAVGAFAGFLTSGGFHGTGGPLSFYGTAVAVNLVMYTVLFYIVAGGYWFMTRKR